MRNAKTTRTVPALLTLAASLMLGVSAAQANVKLVSAEPAPNATVTSPTLIQLHFSEGIAKKFSSIELTDAAGNAIASMAMPAGDAKSLAMMPNQQLRPGVYIVTWTAVATDDGHNMTGRYSFTVR